MIYKNGGDLLTSLSWALGACKHEPPEEAFYLHTKGGKPDKSKILKASDILNDIIHSEIPKHSTRGLKLSLHNFNITNKKYKPLTMDIH